MGYLDNTGLAYLWQKVKTLLNAKAPTSHASTATTYGKSTASNYGHVKLSDSTSSTSAASAGIAASPKAVKAAYDLASTANTAASTAQTAAAAAQSTADAAMPKSGGTFTGDITMGSGRVYLHPWGGTSTKIGDANNTEIRYWADPNGHAVFAVFQNDTWVRTLFEADTNGTVYLSVLMPKSGGTFTGDVNANASPAPNWSFKNISVHTSAWGNIDDKNVYRIIMIRK